MYRNALYPAANYIGEYLPTTLFEFYRPFRLSVDHPDLDELELLGFNHDFTWGKLAADGNTGAVQIDDGNARAFCLLGAILRMMYDLSQQKLAYQTALLTYKAEYDYIAHQTGDAEELAAKAAQITTAEDGIDDITDVILGVEEIKQRIEDETGQAVTIVSDDFPRDKTTLLAWLEENGF